MIIVVLFCVASAMSRRPDCQSHSRAACQQQLRCFAPSWRGTTKEKIQKQQQLDQLQNKQQDLVNHYTLPMHQQQQDVQTLQARSSMQGISRVWVQMRRQWTYCMWSVMVAHPAAVAHLMRRSDMHRQTTQPRSSTKQLPLTVMTLLRTLQQPPKKHRPQWRAQLWHRCCRSCSWHAYPGKGRRQQQSRYQKQLLTQLHVKQQGMKTSSRSSRRRSGLSTCQLQM
jgi:hypothetical protein